MSAANLTGSAVHSHRNGVDTGECRCPWCRQTVSRDELIEIQVRQDELATEIEEQVKSRLIAERDAEIERVRQEAATAVEVAEEAMVKREAAIRKDAIAAANATLAPKLAQAEQDRKALEQRFKTLQSSTETVIAARMEAERIRFESKTAEAVVAERTKAFGEKAALEQQLADMQRRLQAKTAHQLGEPAEVDLFEALETAFPDDRISRVVKGVKGPDVIVEVMHGGAVVGSIILDSKNHKSWQNKFTSKLRSDQLAEGADFAILSSSVFPAGSQQLFLQDNVIVAAPQRVPVLVHLLRRQIVENYRHKLGAEARDEKTARLYAFMTSDRASDWWDRIAATTIELLDTEQKDAAWQEKTRTKRIGLIRAVQVVRDEFTGEIDCIVRGEPEDIL